MRAVGAGHAQGEQSPQGRMGNDVRRIVEEARIKPGLLDDKFGSDAEPAQGRRNLPGTSEVDVAGGSLCPVSRRGRLLTYADWLPTVARRQKCGAIKFLMSASCRLIGVPLRATRFHFWRLRRSRFRAGHDLTAVVATLPAVRHTSCAGLAGIVVHSESGSDP